MPKRADYTDWDEFFMAVAKEASKRSKDPNTRHGAVIVNFENRIISTGYNGLTRGLNDDGCPSIAINHHLPNISNNPESFYWTYDYWASQVKELYIVHAEQNAIYNATESLKGTTMYLFSEKGYYPCTKGCAQAIAQVQIAELVLDRVCESEKYDWGPTLHILEMANVKVRVLNEN